LANFLVIVVHIEVDGEVEVVHNLEVEAEVEDVTEMDRQETGWMMVVLQDEEEEE
jgi:hypothetical protein